MILNIQKYFDLSDKYLWQGTGSNFKGHFPLRWVIKHLAISIISTVIVIIINLLKFLYVIINLCNTIIYKGQRPFHRTMSNILGNHQISVLKKNFYMPSNGILSLKYIVIKLFPNPYSLQFSVILSMVVQNCSNLVISNIQICFKIYFC